MQSLNSEISIRDICERLRTAWEVNTNRDLGRILEIGETTPGSWISRDKLPFKECIKTAQLKSVSLDSLIFGTEKAEPLNALCNESLDAGIQEALIDALEIDVLPELDAQLLQILTKMISRSVRDKLEANEGLADESLENVG